MSERLRRIDPEDAEDFDAETETLLRRWAARKLDVADDAVARVLIEVTGGCGEGTCEFTTARAQVDLTDGRIFLGPDQGFGLFIRDVVSMDVNPDGTEHRIGHMWDLYGEDGKRVTREPEPKKPAAVMPKPPAQPEMGAIRIETSTDDYGRVADRRMEVLTAHGWVDLRELIAVYDNHEESAHQ